MLDHESVWQEVRPGSAWDPDASRAAEKLSAYFQLEQARASRRLLWRVAALLAVAALVFQAVTRVLPGMALVIALTALGTLAFTAAVIEWRAEKHLSALSHPR